MSKPQLTLFAKGVIVLTIVLFITALLAITKYLFTYLVN